MSTPTSSSLACSRKPLPCRFYSQGYCRFKDKCKFSHDANAQPTGNASHLSHLPQPRESDSAIPPSGPPVHGTSGTRPRPKRGEIPCRVWKAGTCTKGSKCWFAHNVDVQKPEPKSSKPKKQKPAVTSRPASPITEKGPSASQTARSPRVESNLVEAGRSPAQKAGAITARQRIIREEAAKTITRLFSGSIVTFSAGLDVRKLITGFETCALRVGNLPPDVKGDDIDDLLRGPVQGLGLSHFHYVIKKKSGRRPEAHVVTDIASGRSLASDLDGAEFQEETLTVKMSAANSFGGMSAATGRGSEILTISWHAPSTRYVAKYPGITEAEDKVKELDCLIYRGRRMKAELYSPRNHFVALRHNMTKMIKIDNLPLPVTNRGIINLTESRSVRRLPYGGASDVMYTVEKMAILVQDDIEQVLPGRLRKFDRPSGTYTTEGVVSARAHLSSWDDAHIAYIHLLDRRYGNQRIRPRFPDPVHFTLTIPMEQYKAQRTQWDNLLGSIENEETCSLDACESGDVVHIRLSGLLKEATGALKVRVENLARGEKVEGWHRSLGFPGNSFIPRVHADTGAYLRADWELRALKVYGTSGAVDQAREMIEGELDRLASLDYTVTLARRSVDYFVREGIQQLKEIFGENNVKFATLSRQITLPDSEEARHALDRLITVSHKGNSGLTDTSQVQKCPLCHGSISSPYQLECGHTYCVTCLRRFISSTLGSGQLPLTCPGGKKPRCRVPIAIPIIQQFLPPATFNRLLEAAFDTYIAKRPEEFKHCKTPGCTQIYRVVQAHTDPQILRCPSCFSVVSNACHEDGRDDLSRAESKVKRAPAPQEPLNPDRDRIASQGKWAKKSLQVRKAGGK